MKEKIQTDQAPKAIGPYSQAIKCGDLVFCSGQIPLSPTTGKLVEGGVAEQTHQVLKNLQAILTKAGSSMDKVVKTTIFLTDLGDFGVVNEIYGSYFQEPFPARATIQVSRLPMNVVVEIEAVASTK